MKLVVFIALVSLCNAQIDDMYDCSPLELFYPTKISGYHALSTNPPVKVCPSLCFPTKSESTLTEVKVKVGGETKTVKIQVFSDLGCTYVGGKWGEVPL